MLTSNDRHRVRQAAMDNGYRTLSSFSGNRTARTPLTPWW